MPGSAFISCCSRYVHLYLHQCNCLRISLLCLKSHAGHHQWWISGEACPKQRSNVVLGLVISLPFLMTFVKFCIRNSSACSLRFFFHAVRCAFFASYRSWSRTLPVVESLYRLQKSEFFCNCRFIGLWTSMHDSTGIRMNFMWLWSSMLEEYAVDWSA